MRRMIFFAVAVVVVVGVGVGAAKLMSGDPEDDPTMLTHTVKRGDLLITVTEDGNLESAKNVDIKCQVLGGSTILSIVEDGKQVKAGEKLVELDASVIDDQISAQQIVYEKAVATLRQAENTYNVAVIAIEEYEEGTFRQELQTAETTITLSKESLRSAENALEYGKRMFTKGYITKLQLESQEFAVEASKLELESATTAKDVLVRFQKKKMMEDLTAARDTAQAQLNSEKAAFELEEARLNRYKDQLKACTIFAPADGMVIYYKPQMMGRRFGGSSAPDIEEGAAVRERQTIIQVPDLSEMQVKVTVHESKVDQLERGMRARLTVQDRDLQGTLVYVASQPEATSFMQANVKEYAATVRLDGKAEGLKPGMTAEVEILVDHLKNVISIPVAAVVELRGKHYCWVKTPSGGDQRPLIIGKSNDKFIEIKDGVKEGDEIVLNPRARYKAARESDEGQDGDVNIDDRFGASQADPAGGPAARSERPGGGQRRAGGGGRGRQDGADRGAGPGGEGRRGQTAKGPGGRAQRGGGGNLMQNDRDGDGKISIDEAPERMQPFFDRIDANGDGFIDQTEVRARQQGRGKAGGGGGFGNRPPL